MTKLVILSLGQGDLKHGFLAVTAQLWDVDIPRPTMKFTGGLPPAPELIDLYWRWQFLYEELYRLWDWRPRGSMLEPIEIDEADVTHVSEVDFNDLSQSLQRGINTWLNSELFRTIDQKLRTQLDAAAEIRLIVETQDEQLRQLPWHLWNFFEDYPRAELALSISNYQQANLLPATTCSRKVRILVILGNSQGIDVEHDRQLLNQLPNGAATFLVEPPIEALNDQLWLQGWDVLFFAGHSSSRTGGQIQLNQRDRLTIPQLKYALRKAIASGLKLAIFNSCDGLGLAQDLADLQIPQVVVMREPVPDQVAQVFLKHFLMAFARGRSLYGSMREAREKLHGLERSFPCASWLPVICQNPAEVPPTWRDWCREEPRLKQWSIRTVLIASVVVTAFVVGVRQLGMLQSLELQAFDSLMRLRPDEGPDPRLLIITVTEADIQAQAQKYRSSLSDDAMSALLKKLEPFQPRIIAADIYHDFPFERKEMMAHLQQDQRFIGVCEVGGTAENPGIAAPKGMAVNRVGFSDVLRDRDGILRRHLLAMSPGASPCQADKAFSFRIAVNYLAQMGIPLTLNQQEYFQLGSVTFKTLEKNTGGYHDNDDRGHQILLNYRSAHQVARQVTLAEVLHNRVDPSWVKDHIVLIGTTATSVKDYFLTPYSATQQPQPEMPGINAQAQMVSQILSAVLDHRPLVWWWSKSSEVIWIWLWSVSGGLVVWRFSTPRSRGTVILAAMVGLGVISWIALIFGGWIPLVPAILALVITSSGIVIYQNLRDQQ